MIPLPPALIHLLDPTPSTLTLPSLLTPTDAMDLHLEGQVTLQELIQILDVE